MPETVGWILLYAIKFFSGLLVLWALLIAVNENVGDKQAFPFPPRGFFWVYFFDPLINFVRAVLFLAWLGVAANLPQSEPIKALIGYFSDASFISMRLISYFVAATATVIGLLYVLSSKQTLRGRFIYEVFQHAFWALLFFLLFLLPVQLCWCLLYAFWQTWRIPEVTMLHIPTLLLSIYGVIVLSSCVQMSLGLLEAAGHALLNILIVVRPYVPLTAFPSFSMSPECPSACPDQPVFKILLVSDTHFAGGSNTVMENPTGRTSETTRAFVQHAISTEAPNVVLHCGDVTDTGSQHDWEFAAQSFACLPAPLLIIPGNHDFHFKWAGPVNEWARHLVELPAESSYGARGVYRRLANISHAGTLDLLQEFWMDGVRERTKDPAAIEKAMQSRIFPQLYMYPIPGEDKRVFIALLDSNRRPPTTPITNAMGKVGSNQLRMLEYVLRLRRASDFLIVVLHHHILPPRFSIQAAFLTCVDARRVWYVSQKLKADCIVHGHKHMPYVASRKTVQLDFSRPGLVSGLLRSFRSLRRTLGIKRKNRTAFRDVKIISCGSAHHPAEGQFKDTVNSASCYLLKLYSRSTPSITLVKDDQFS